MKRRTVRWWLGGRGRRRPGAAVQIYRLLSWPRRAGLARCRAARAALVAVALALSGSAHRAGSVRAESVVERDASLDDIRLPVRAHRRGTFHAALPGRVPGRPACPGHAVHSRLCGSSARRGTRARPDALPLVVAMLVPAVVYFVLHSLHDRVQRQLAVLPLSRPGGGGMCHDARRPDGMDRRPGAMVAPPGRTRRVGAACGLLRPGGVRRRADGPPGSLCPPSCRGFPAMLRSRCSRRRAPMELARS